jgi:3-phosphoshikimate 1-carboxyvinyltransferase
MRLIINPGQLEGTVNAIPSKSMTHRYLMTSSLSNGVSKLKKPLRCEDTLASVYALRKLGIDIHVEETEWEIFGGTLTPTDTVIDCNESGTTLRLLTGLCSLLSDQITLSGAPSLIRRPNEPLLIALEQLGVKCSSRSGYPPIKVKGRLKGGEACIRGDVSSQFISSILIAAPYAENPITLRISTKLESKPYVEMTVNVMEKSGIKPSYNENMNEIHVPIGEYHPQKHLVEGDWSSAAFMIAAGVISGKVRIDNINIESLQADREILGLLHKMSARIKIEENRITAERSRLKPIEADLSNCPDLFPIIACLCSIAEGTSELKGLARLRYKESDRLTAVSEGLEKMGIKVSGTDSTITIEGGKPRGTSINPYNDHRVAMSFAILAHVAEGRTEIQTPECVSKSYPDFWRDLKKLGANIT